MTFETLAGSDAPETPPVTAPVVADNSAPAEENTKPVEAEASEKPETPKAEEAKPEAEVEYSFEMPEGIEIDEPSANEFKGIAKELKLSKEAAQKVVDIAVKREVQRAEAWKTQVEGWKKEVETDKEIGGDKLNESMSLARKAVALGPPELKEFLNTSGIGNHPAFVKWAASIGKALSEDSFVKGGNPPAPKENKTLGQKLYG